MIRVLNPNGSYYVQGTYRLRIGFLFTKCLYHIPSFRERAGGVPELSES